VPYEEPNAKENEHHDEEAEDLGREEKIGCLHANKGHGNKGQANDCRGDDAGTRVCRLDIKMGGALPRKFSPIGIDDGVGHERHEPDHHGPGGKVQGAKDEFRKRQGDCRDQREDGHNQGQRDHATLNDWGDFHVPMPFQRVWGL